MRLADVAFPHDISVYLVHLVVGGAILVLGGIALTARKGGRRHVLAGRVFSVASVCAGITALLFMADIGFVHNIFATAMLAIAVVASSFLALRAPSRLVRLGELAIFLVTLSVAVVLTVRFFEFAGKEGLFASPSLFTFACASFPIFFVIYDAYFITRDREQRHAAKLQRHAIGMAFVCALMIHAPVVSVFTDVQINFFVKFFGPYALWPAIYYHYFYRVRAKCGLAAFVRQVPAE